MNIDGLYLLPLSSSLQILAFALDNVDFLTSSYLDLIICSLSTLITDIFLLLYLLFHVTDGSAYSHSVT